MTFYVRKSLAHAPIRFGVTPRQPVEVIDAEPALSTGPSGDFVRRRTHGYFFADVKSVDAPTVQSAESIRSTSLWQSMMPDGTARGWLTTAGLIFGALLILLALINLAQGPDHRSAGLVLIIVGLAVIAVPVLVTVQRRRMIAAEEEKARAENEERERRHREILASYTAALNRLREKPDEQALAAALRERENLDAPYRIWSPLARRTVLQIGFDALAKEGPSGAKGVSALMSRASEAVGLTAEDESRVKTDVYRTVLWHLLADDRVGRVQQQELAQLRGDLGISDEDLSDDIEAAEEFDMLRGVTTKNLPRQQCDLKLNFGEYCVHTTPATLIDEKGREAPSTLFVTNKRVIVAGKKMQDVAVSQIDDVEVEIEKHLLVVRVARPASPLRMRVAKPIYAASLIDLVTCLDERPKGFS